MQELFHVGYARNSDGDIVKIMGKSYADGSTEFMFDNDPYGVISAYGKFPYTPEKLDRVSPNVASMKKFTAEWVECRGTDEGIIALSSGDYFNITDLQSFSGEWMPSKAGGKVVYFDGYMDVTDLDEDSEDYSDFMEAIQQVRIGEE